MLFSASARKEEFPKEKRYASWAALQEVSKSL